jgi:murein DD-endopeptidase MepM/ murein hydrolase activator NlpD
LATLHHRLRSRSRRTLLVSALIATSVLAAPAALAAPGDGTVGGAQAAYDDLREEIARIQAQVSAAEETLQRTTVEAEAAGEATRAAEAALATAEEEAAAAAAELANVRSAVDRTQDDVATLGREAYMGEGRLGSAAALLDSRGPGELLQRAATLELLGAERAERLDQLEDVEAQEARADEAARAAVRQRDAAAEAAAAAQAAADGHLAEARAEFDRVAGEKADLEQELRAAEVELLRLEGAENAERQWAAQQAAEEAVGTVAAAPAAAGAAVAPTSGRVSSCYGARWGTMHYGIDIAAPIGTPIYAPEAGTVVAAGPASGFGLAVGVQHADGSITLYGHVNQMFVSTGQAVSAGQQIAEVGNRGQSTGPHLHFEVHTGGLYASRQNPAPWLAARGISLGGSC